MAAGIGKEILEEEGRWQYLGYCTTVVQSSPGSARTPGPCHPPPPRLVGGNFLFFWLTACTCVYLGAKRSSAVARAGEIFQVGVVGGGREGGERAGGREGGRKAQQVHHRGLPVSVLCPSLTRCRSSKPNPKTGIFPIPSSLMSSPPSDLCPSLPSSPLSLL